MSRFRWLIDSHFESITAKNRLTRPGLSTRIEADKAQYYEQLQRAQRGTGDITDWLCWFAECVERAAERAGADLVDRGLFVRLPGAGRSASYGIAW